MIGRFLARTAAAVLAVTAAGTAHAQSYDGDGLIKFGAFGQMTFLNYGIARPAPGSATGSGLIGGLSIGYDYRPSPHWLIGVELDAALGDARGTFNTTSYGLDYLMMLRGRFGVYPDRDWLLYGTAGFAFLGFEAQQPGLGNKEVETISGMTVGLGAEYNWHHVLLFGEYNFANFGARQFTINDVRHETDADVHMLRFGIKFKVGHDYHDIGRHYDPLK